MFLKKLLQIAFLTNLKIEVFMDTWYIAYTFIFKEIKKN